MDNEREIIKQNLTHCHIDELMTEPDKINRNTEVRDNYKKFCINPPKLSRKEIYKRKLYDEVTRKVLIEHELELKCHAAESSDSEYKKNFSHTQRIPINTENHVFYPVYKVDDAITFWTSSTGTKPSTIRKKTAFSKPIDEQLDTQFH